MREGGREGGREGPCAAYVWLLKGRGKEERRNRFKEELHVCVKSEYMFVRVQVVVVVVECFFNEEEEEQLLEEE